VRSRRRRQHTQGANTRKVPTHATSREAAKAFSLGRKPQGPFPVRQQSLGGAKATALTNTPPFQHNRRLRLAKTLKPIHLPIHLLADLDWPKPANLPPRRRSRCDTTREFAKRTFVNFLAATHDDANLIIPIRQTTIRPSRTPHTGQTPLGIRPRVRNVRSIPLHRPTV